MVTDKENQWKAVGSPTKRLSLGHFSDNNSFQFNQLQNNAQTLQPPPGLGMPKLMQQKEDDLEFKQIENEIQNNQNDDIWYFDDLPKRSRSKSSSAIFGDFEQLPPQTIWDNVLHRRSSTQPSQQLVWEALKASQLATKEDMNGTNIDIIDKYKQMQQGRRFSVAPGVVNKFMTRFDDNQVLEEEEVYDFKRRHSVHGNNNEFEMDLPIQDLKLSENEKINENQLLKFLLLYQH